MWPKPKVNFLSLSDLSEEFDLIHYSLLLWNTTSSDSEITLLFSFYSPAHSSSVPLVGCHFLLFQISKCGNAQSSLFGPFLSRFYWWSPPVSCIEIKCMCSWLSDFNQQARSLLWVLDSYIQIYSTSPLACLLDISNFTYPKITTAYLPLSHSSPNYPL